MKEVRTNITIYSDILLRSHVIEGRVYVGLSNYGLQGRHKLAANAKHLIMACLQLVTGITGASLNSVGKQVFIHKNHPVEKLSYENNWGEGNCTRST